MPHRVTEVLKSHVLNQLETAGFSKPDLWIYFTVLGSGASYNWDEAGDFDVHMWVNYQTYLEHNPDHKFNSDSLLSEIRYNNHLINNPTFKESTWDTLSNQMIINHNLECLVRDMDRARNLYALEGRDSEGWCPIGLLKIRTAIRDVLRAQNPMDTIKRNAK